MGLNISNETNDLVSVILGIADEMGKKPSAEDCIDPKTKYHIINNSYPKEEDCKIEIENFNNILFKNGVEVLRPNSIQNLDQIFKVFDIFKRFSAFSNLSVNTDKTEIYQINFLLVMKKETNSWNTDLQMTKSQMEINA